MLITDAAEAALQEAQDRLGHAQQASRFVDAHNTFYRAAIDAARMLRVPWKPRNFFCAVTPAARSGFAGQAAAMAIRAWVECFPPNTRRS